MSLDSYYFLESFYVTTSFPFLRLIELDVNTGESGCQDYNEFVMHSEIFPYKMKKKSCSRLEIGINKYK